MPELPEVESLRLKMAPQILAQKFSTLILRRPDLRYPIPPALARELPGATVTAVRRRSKYLLIDTDAGKTWVVHLGMSGRFFFAAHDLPLHQHDHVVAHLHDGRELRFRDPRRFGLMDWLPTPNLESHKWFANLGVEPLSADFTADGFAKICAKSVSPIKLVLMNAEAVVGVGNIYANEALFLAKIFPKTRACDLKRAQIQRLCRHVKEVLQKSITAGGTTFRDYVGANQEPGLYRIELFVYGRDGEPCRVCKSPIQVLRLSGRSTFFCPRCQKGL